MSWPRKPPKDARCDAHVGDGVDHLGTPVLYRCPNPATESCKQTTGLPGEMWLCESCAIAIEAKGYVLRKASQ